MTADPWEDLRRLTPARIALGRAGPGLPTDAVLALALDHARARDAVHLPFDAGAVAAGLEALNMAVTTVASAAPDRATYLRRPDLGRQLAQEHRDRLQASRSRGRDVVVVVADGLSSAAVHAHAAPLLAELEPQLGGAGLSLTDIVLAHQARVALGDAIGQALGARIAVVLIGERPGLSSPDSLGAYITFGPRVGRTDAERNCVSNIRPAGLGYEEASLRIAWLVGAALKLGATGVALKDDSGLAARPLQRAVAPPALPVIAPDDIAFADPITARIVHFVREIGIPVRRGKAAGPIPGIAVKAGGLVVDEPQLTWPGDLLHEAGHLAVCDPVRRAMSNDVGDDPAEETATIAWSYAAARHLGLDPALVFHAEFRGGGEAMIAAFEGQGPGVPMLQRWGMTGGWFDEPRFPRMTRWLR